MNFVIKKKEGKIKTLDIEFEKVQIGDDYMGYGEYKLYREKRNKSISFNWKLGIEGKFQRLNWLEGGRVGAGYGVT